MGRGFTSAFARVSAVFALSMGLSGCMHRPADPAEGRFEGTAIKLQSTSQICTYLQEKKKNDEAKAVGDALAELQHRNMTKLTVEQVYRGPQAGLKDNEILCIWGQPNGIRKNLSADGEAQELWVYNKGQRLFGYGATMTEKLYFQNGVLTETDAE